MREEAGESPPQKKIVLVGNHHTLSQTTTADNEDRTWAAEVSCEIRNTQFKSCNLGIASQRICKNLRIHEIIFHP